ncbi:acyltransferase family protein [Curvivirga sp.]|uniref:acyltransferase family protein n=1 Tax=Curvivirga sp. TaxID=2856848 RepID=UPI003B59ACB3
MNYRADIDGLRACAVIPVILFHAGFEAFSGGYVGVDIFFVISGFLITSIILKEIDNESFSIINFYERRARRILPALGLISILSIPFAWAWMFPQQLLDYSQSLFSMGLFSSNFLFWWESGYFDLVAEEKPFLHTWSLAVEEQFYVLFPILMCGLLVVSRKLIVSIILILWLASYFFLDIVSLFEIPESLSALINEPKFAFFLPFSRAWELLTGAIIAFILYHKEIKSSQLLSILGLLLLVCGFFLPFLESSLSRYNVLVSVIGTALIILFSSAGTISYKLLSSGILVAIGLISYSAYLWHMPLFAFARIKSYFSPSDSVFLLLSVLSLVLGFVSWKYIELPFRDRTKFSRKQIFFFSFLLLTFFIGVGAIGHLYKGFPDRLSNEARNLIVSTNWSPKLKDCHTSGQDYLLPSQACTYFNDKVTWATLGDSHVIELSYALALELKEQGIGLKHLSYSGCPPLVSNYSEVYKYCSSWTTEAIDELINKADIKNVVINYRYSYHLFGENLNLYPDHPDFEPESIGGDLSVTDKRELLWSSFKNLLLDLAGHKENIYILLPYPELDKNVQRMIFRSDIDGAIERVIGIPRSHYDERNSFILNKMRDTKFPDNITFIDPSKFLCDNSFCYVTLNGELMYLDSNHLSVEATTRIAREIVSFSER